MGADAQKWFETLNGMVDCAPDDCKAKIHYKFLYNYACAEINTIRSKEEFKNITGDYKLMEAMAGLYLVQEYAANQLAVLDDESS